MERRGLQMPDLWYRMPTYTNRNICGLGEPDTDIVWPGYSKKLDFEFEIGIVIGKMGRNIRRRMQTAISLATPSIMTLVRVIFRRTKERSAQGPARARILTRAMCLVRALSLPRNSTRPIFL